MKAFQIVVRPPGRTPRIVHVNKFPITTRTEEARPGRKILDHETDTPTVRKLFEATHQTTDLAERDEIPGDCGTR
jgi:hypothetical protein